MRCPTCDRPVEWTEAYPYRPFCSERCRLIDLGAWLSGSRSIPGEEPAGGSDPGPNGSDGSGGNGGTGSSIA